MTLVERAERLGFTLESARAVGPATYCWILKRDGKKVFEGLLVLVETYLDGYADGVRRGLRR